MNDTPSSNKVADAVQEAGRILRNVFKKEGAADDCEEAATLLRHLDAENRRLREEVEALKAKADNCWGAANYRLKYLAMVGHKLGLEYDDQGDTRYASKLYDLAESFRTRLADAERECDDHRKIKEAEKLILIEEVAKNAKLETALHAAESSLKVASLDVARFQWMLKAIDGMKYADVPLNDLPHGDDKYVTPANFIAAIDAARKASPSSPPPLR